MEYADWVINELKQKLSTSKLQKLLVHSTLAMPLKTFKNITPKNPRFMWIVDIHDY